MKPVFKYIKLFSMASLFFCLIMRECFASSVMANKNSNVSNEGSTMHNVSVYKILKLTEWEESQKLGFIKPSPLDVESNFIHLSEEYQVQKTIDKFMKNEKNIIILKLDPSKFEGRLVKEKNPGGEVEYYHLYEGKIPLQAVTEVKTQ